MPRRLRQRRRRSSRASSDIGEYSVGKPCPQHDQHQGAADEGDETRHDAIADALDRAVHDAQRDEQPSQYLHVRRGQAGRVCKQHRCIEQNRQFQEIAEIVEARLSEIFSLVDKELRKVGKSGQLPAGVVLTGGGAKMPDIVDYAKEELRLPGQIGLPSGIPVAVDKIDDPAFATAVGLVLWGAGTEVKAGRFKRGSLPFSVSDTVGKMKKWFKTFLP